MKLRTLLPLFFVVGAAKAQTGPLQAESFAGTDIGEQVNRAFASANEGSAQRPAARGKPAARSAVVNLLPGQRYPFATTILLPNDLRAPFVSDPTLDCHGSTLVYTGGTGSAVFVPGGYRGTLRDCFIEGHTSDSLIEIHGRPLFLMEHVQVQGAGTACIHQVNTTAEGGPGFTENQHFRDIRLFSCPGGQTMSIGPGGTNSFDYNWYEEYHLNLLPGQFGFWFTAGTEPQGTHISANANGVSPGAGETTIVRIDGNFLRGVIDLHGENTGGVSTFLAVAGKGYAHFTGTIQVAGLTAPMTSNFLLHESMAPMHSQYGVENGAQIIEEGDGGLGTISRQSRFQTGTQHWRAWLANYGPENDGSVSVIHCPTGRDQIVTTVPLAACGWSLYLPATGGAGFGKGFGDPFAGSKTQPPYPGRSPAWDVETHSLGISSPDFNASRAWTWDADGSTETIRARSTHQVFVDGAITASGWTCAQAGRVVRCEMPGQLAAGAISTPALVPSVAVAPRGSCSLPNGSLVLSQDGHAVTCTGGYYVARW